jgi:hypothetical protein
VARLPLPRTDRFWPPADGYKFEPKVVYDFCPDLQVGWLKDQVEREARFNRMFDKVSQGRARKFLLEHGCAPW